MDAKNDTETQFRSRKLPLTRKIYAFYRAPIVKFWSNTVGRLQSRAEARAHSHVQPPIVVVYQRGALSHRHCTGRVFVLVFCFKKNDMNM